MTPTTKLFSQQLTPPKLHFDYALRIQVSHVPFDGFRQWGPYDKNQPRKTQIRCAVIYPVWAALDARKLREAFQKGMFFFKGFYAFSRGISITEFDEIALQIGQELPTNVQAVAYRTAIEQLAKDAKWDFVFVVIPFTPRYVYESPYYAVKLTLSSYGIPCQLITLEKLRSDEAFKWSLVSFHNQWDSLRC